MYREHVEIVCKQPNIFRGFIKSKHLNMFMVGYVHLFPPLFGVDVDSIEQVRLKGLPKGPTLKSEMQHLTIEPSIPPSKHVYVSVIIYMLDIITAFMPTILL